MADLSSLNTFSLRSFAPHFFALTHRDQLPELMALSAKFSECFILGGGSNIILPETVQSLIIHQQMKGIRCLQHNDEGVWVEVAGGENWHEFVQYCLAQGWYGLENLAFIPGTVGASPVQNIGAYGKEVKQYIHEVHAIQLKTGKQQTFSKEACQFAYRDSVFKHEAHDYLILSVVFFFPKKWEPCMDYADLQRASLHACASAQDIFDAVVRIRQEKLPDVREQGNAGSFFKNPIISASVYDDLKKRFPFLVAYPQEDGRYKLAAAWLIDQCGWKGKTLGKVGVHDRQALVLVNRGGASAKDVWALAQAIRQDVQAKFQVSLEPEPIFVY